MRFSWVAIVCTILLSCESGDSSFESSTGQGGSMTRFAIQGDYLYVVDQTSIQTFRLQGNSFEKVNQTPVTMRLETIFPKGDYLYLGAADAMYIYSIADPASPQFIFRYAHIVSCDPVVVQGTTAYVTLRSGTACNRGANALEIIDISNPNNPKLLANYPMTSPHGLGVDGTCLFLCEGPAGLKVFDVSNPLDIVLTTQIDDIYAYDVIPRNGLLTLTGEDGVFQYNYNCDNHSLELVSKIPVLRGEL